jgi:transposase-like protein
MRKRRKFSDDFKAKVALKNLRGDLPVLEIASRHKIHSNLAS